ncbi:MAG: riboflavin synthase [Ferrovum sp. 37-45-19]|uniref:riboflavin synthase n=1 Tax=Ferrovum sp. JA12 TaxID=1356299 RepID=UPI000702C333|nr:riboflavin synthase [Ferrovum sp. JA12]OYV79840.1 MAG: riboflavin synthase [Ferrovum sp. 21-44-67]OYV95464.1 MAG: riboflavin synthase [Ferrovum sp. 37-45-19]OZB31512.1 MAG: riboflavin synthase [Ferrovum sp. 34-44-207]HQU05713.1 riboflavin synthase [Ferrovaceae bacterium]KRH78147.1 riboflavin synthase [Ferrovum sp. JA12]
MFTGIIAATGKIAGSEKLEQGQRLHIDTSMDLSDVAVGDSIAVNGVCLTVVKLVNLGFLMDVSRHTLDVTVGLELGRIVNLEKALRLSDRLGGHLVSGHVDGIGEIMDYRAIGESWFLEIKAPHELSRYIAKKGSITVNGISLTTNTVDADLFTINVIPHTREVTNFKELSVGDSVNLEIDLIARYIERSRLWESE